jgi:pimeloyl-ACP methyl ester carboxylesterase
LQTAAISKEEKTLNPKRLRKSLVSGLCIASVLATGQLVFADDVKFRRQFVDGPQGQLHVLSSTPASQAPTAPAVLSLAPNPMAGRYFSLYMAALGTDREMLAIDYPGNGDSDAPSAALDAAGYADAMAAGLDALGYGAGGKGAVDVMGYHSGTFIAVELAIRRPDLVRKIILSGVPYYDPEVRQAEYDRTVVHEPLSEDFASVAHWWQFTVSNRQDGVTLRRAYSNFIDVLKTMDHHEWLYDAVFKYPADERAAEVTQPVLILNNHGGLKEQTREFAAYLPNVEVVELPELHHGIYDVGADILARHSRAFLDD